MSVRKIYFPFQGLAQATKTKSTLNVYIGNLLYNDLESDIGTTTQNFKKIRRQEENKKEKNKNNARAKLETRTRGEGVAWKRGRI